jgi:hypothetical protein
MRGEVVFETRFDKRGDTIHMPKHVLEDMGLPTERNAIRDADVYLYAAVFGEDGEHLGTRRKRLLPKKEHLLAHTRGALVPELHADSRAPQAGSLGKPGRGKSGRSGSISRQERTPHQSEIVYVTTIVYAVSPAPRRPPQGPPSR